MNLSTSTLLRCSSASDVEKPTVSDAISWFSASFTAAPDPTCARRWNRHNRSGWGPVSLQATHRVRNVSSVRVGHTNRASIGVLFLRGCTSPMWMGDLPSAQITGQADEAVGSLRAPIMMSSVPAAASGCDPSTGASRYSAPSASTAAAISRLWSGPVHASQPVSAGT